MHHPWQIPTKIRKYLLLLGFYIAISEKYFWRAWWNVAGICKRPINWIENILLYCCLNDWARYLSTHSAQEQNKLHRNTQWGSFDQKWHNYMIVTSFTEETSFLFLCSEYPLYCRVLGQVLNEKDTVWVFHNCEM